jgi:hypothetical protein
MEVGCIAIVSGCFEHLSAVCYLAFRPIMPYKSTISVALGILTPLTRRESFIIEIIAVLLVKL